MKFSGKVGFWEGSRETKPGIYKSQIVERPYNGDVITSTRRFQSTEFQNDDLKLSNRISILSDLYAQQNWTSIRYIVWNGTKLKVNSVEVNYPRLILDVGGIYNGS